MVRQRNTLASVVLILATAAIFLVGHKAAASGKAWCTVEASYNHRYKNYDVYVHSNQPYRSAQVTGSRDGKWSYERNGNGYADVYLYARGGQRVNVTVGKARCSTTLS